MNYSRTELYCTWCLNEGHMVVVRTRVQPYMLPYSLPACMAHVMEISIGKVIYV